MLQSFNVKQNKLECFSVASLSSLFKYFRERPVLNLSEPHSPLGHGPALTHIFITTLEIVFSGKRSNLFYSAEPLREVSPDRPGWLQERDNSHIFK
jgi:hypothetical protein